MTFNNAVRKARLDSGGDTYVHLDQTALLRELTNLMADMVYAQMVTIPEILAIKQHLAVIQTQTEATRSIVQNIQQSRR